jgi:hypothetical protein
MNKQLMNAYDKLKMNLIQSPNSFDLLYSIITNPNASSLDEVIKYDKMKLTRPDGNELTNAVLAEVCNVCKISPSELFSRFRYREFNDARIIYTAFLRMGTDWSYAKISAHLLRHHATMIHNMKSFDALINTDKIFRKKVTDIIKLLNNQKIYTFDDMLTTKKWKYERTNSNLDRSAKIARKTRLLTREEAKRQKQIHTSIA